MMKKLGHFTLCSFVYFEDPSWFSFQSHSSDVPHSVPWRMFADTPKVQHNTVQRDLTVCSREF